MSEIAINAVNAVNEAALELVNSTVQKIINTSATQAAVNRRNGQGDAFGVVAAAAGLQNQSNIKLVGKITNAVTKLKAITEQNIKNPLLEFYTSLQTSV